MGQQELLLDGRALLYVAGEDGAGLLLLLPHTSGGGKGPPAAGCTAAHRHLAVHVLVVPCPAYIDLPREQLTPLDCPQPLELV